MLWDGPLSSNYTVFISCPSPAPWNWKLVWKPVAANWALCHLKVCKPSQQAVFKILQQAGLPHTFLKIINYTSLYSLCSGGIRSHSVATPPFPTRPSVTAQQPWHSPLPPAGEWGVLVGLGAAASPECTPRTPVGWDTLGAMCGYRQQSRETQHCS